jgi:hypothetical protein
MIKILGTLKGVALKSKVDDRGDSIHYIDLKLELVEGSEKIQDIIELLKSILEITLDSKQPTLLAKPYPEDNKED